MEMCHGILSAIIYRRRVCHIRLIVLEPVGNSTLVILHFATHHSHISAVVDDIVPLMLQSLLCLHILGIYHQTRSIAVETMDHMGCAALLGLTEIVVEHRLHVERLMSCRHRQYAWLLLYYHEIWILVNKVHISTLEGVVFLTLRHANLHATSQRIVKLSNYLAIHLDASAMKSVLNLVAAEPFEVCYKPIQ